MTQLTLADWQTRAAAVQFEGRAFINGAYTAPASGRSFPTRNPATRQILCQVAECAAADVDAAVSAAREAFNRGVWADQAPMARKRVIAALPGGLDAAVRAVFAAEGVDEPNAPGDLKRAVRDCLKANLPA